MTWAVHGGDDLPWWVDILELADLWRIPPWQLEAEVSAQWVDRKTEWERAKAMRKKHG